MTRRRSFIARCTALGLAMGAGPTVRAQERPVDEASTDPARDRSLPLRLRWPPGEGPCGLIVHSHGLGGSREGGDVLGRAWQQAGFAVLHLQHPGSDTEVFRRGLPALHAAASAEQLLARVRDMQFAVDEITRRVASRAAGWSRVRLDALGASGHSFGAATVQALAAQRFAAASLPHSKTCVSRPSSRSVRRPGRECR